MKTIDQVADNPALSKELFNVAVYNQFQVLSGNQELSVMTLMSFTVINIVKVTEEEALEILPKKKKRELSTIEQTF